MKQIRNNLLICLLTIIFFLTGCGNHKEEDMDLANEELNLKEAYDNGYEQGYQDGYTSCEEDNKSATEENSIPNSIPSGFVVLSDFIPDVILDIRYYSTYNFVGDRIDGYDEPVAILTLEAAKALKEVSDELRSEGYRLKIYDAYRPQCAVDHFNRWAKDTGNTGMKEYFYPQVEKKDLFAKGYISSKSGHSRGSTVDLTLFDMDTGKDLDMGGTFDYFGIQSHSDYTETLSENQIHNRQILRNAMLAHGFRGITTEWWHFTLEDEPYPEEYFNFPVSIDN